MRRASTAGLVLATLLAVGCGIPEDRHPTTLPGGVITAGLGITTTTGTTPSDPQPAVEATVFLVRAERITPVVRRVPQADLSNVLKALLSGPTEAELNTGTRTAISPQTELRSVAVQGPTAVIDLTSAFVEVGGAEQILALAQVVLTATTVAGISEVRFALEGQPVEVPRADGTLSSGPLTAADYNSLRESAAPSPGR
ncbi:MAG: GerMN domain-containing protein [Acidimicrobiia bacterium]